MTETSTPSDVQVTRERHAAVMRVVADLHAAYGKGVSLEIDIDPTPDVGDHDRPTWLYLMSEGVPGDRAMFGFWDDGEVTTSSNVTLRMDRVEALSLIREFIHRYGHGAR